MGFRVLPTIKIIKATIKAIKTIKPTLKTIKPRIKTITSTIKSIKKTISEGFRVFGLGSASVRDINVNSINLIQREKKRALLRKIFGRSDP